MITYYQLYKRINDLEHSLVPQDVYFTTIHHGRLDALRWCITEQRVRDEQEIKNRIARYQEELLAFPDAHNVLYKERQARIEELTNVIQHKS